MQTGKINVQTENIFPIIKKFLYSDHEIFLRELISNAVDATEKLKFLASRGNIKGDLGDLTIEVMLDKENKILRIRDKGIGMTAEEIDKYINQIAFSSAEEFIAKYKGKSEADAASIIGHFGLGFYSAFMVSSKVEIFSKTYRKGAGTKGIHWSCDGSPEYQLEETDRTERGTDVVLHIADDSLEFLEDGRILSLLKKYCRFLPVPIRFGDEKHWEKIEGEKDEQGHDKYDETTRPRIINNVNPAWKRKPVDLKEEDYQAFYRELYPFSMEEPLFHIHLNVDYPFNLTGILYFPKVKKNIDIQKDKIQLYCNQVFVTDSVEGIVPDFLTLLHGVIDSPDIPLNVSRSYLQSDASVKKISGHITKKVADKLDEIFKNQREEFEKKWDDIRIFIQYGMITDEKFYERAQKFVLLKNIDGQYFTLDSYRQHVENQQKDKNNKLVYLYSNDVEAQHAYIASARERGYDILLMDGTLDQHFIHNLEQKLEDVRFSRVDADTVDRLIEKEDSLPGMLSQEDQEKVRPWIEDVLGKERFSVSFAALSPHDMPMIITRPEFMRRMRDMSALGGMAGFDAFPESLNVVVNTNHALINNLTQLSEDERNGRIRQISDLALLSQQLLYGEALTDFVRRSLGFIDPGAASHL